MSKQALLESLRAEGFPEKIIKAFEKVSREDFIPNEYKIYAYEDTALPVGENQTISQPYTIAFMLNLLELDKLKNKKLKILEIGSGSGYVLSLINEIINNADIYGLEIKEPLAKSSSKILLRCKNIRIINKSGFSGYKEKQPFDRILISASAPSPDVAYKLANQLKDSGVLVSPVQNSIYQIKRENGKVKAKEFKGFVFVPLVDK